MAESMADSLIRKACDRCHGQKLSCKRAGDEPCERCVRLKTECKSSPSLRYKKQQQQQLQKQQQQPSQNKSRSQAQNQNQNQNQNQQGQPQKLPSAEGKGGNRSPKRRRTAEMNLVRPEAVDPQAGELTAHSHSIVTQDPVLGLADFNFNMDHHPVFFAPGQAEYLYQPLVPGRLDDFHPHPHGALNSPWDQRLTSTSTSASFQELSQLSFSHIDSSPISVQGSVQATQPVRTCVPTHRRPDHRQVSAARPRPKQIALRQHPGQSAQGRVASPTNWMSRFTEVHTRLQELSAALPAPETAPASPVLGRPNDERFRRFGFPVDEVFRLTGDVADVLDALSTGRSPNEGTPRVSLSDPGNCLFVIALYVRLLDVFQRIFSLVRRELSHADSHVEFQYWKLPDVSIGSIEVDSSPRFQMALTVQVAQQFLTRLRKSTAALSIKQAENGQPLFPNNASIFAGTVEDTLAAVQAKETSLADYLAGLRGELEAFKDAAEYEDDEAEE
ncbi:Isoflavipucine cluster transcription factor [Paramyrothecium foliicola]|nr:Isoflavipucine cluster transcription factor [Paramyrothecium foliicola]